MHPKRAKGTTTIKMSVEYHVDEEVGTFNTTATLRGLQALILRGCFVIVLSYIWFCVPP